MLQRIASAKNGSNERSGQSRDNCRRATCTGGGTETIVDGQGRARERHAARLETSNEFMRKQEFAVEEVVELFRISEHAVRAAVCQHELPAVMAGPSIQAIQRADLLAWFERRGGVWQHNSPDTNARHPRRTRDAARHTLMPCRAAGRRGVTRRRAG